jgi:single-stranded-DNA-specific exonuclease
VGKGSGRSVKGLNLVEALTHCSDLLVRFGGHELAAGLTVRRRDIPAFRKRLNEYAATLLTEDMTAVRYEADCECQTCELTMAQAEELERLEPFGVGNPTPCLVLRDAVVHRVIPLGGGKHTKLMLYKDGQMLQAVWFSTSPAKIPAVVGDAVDILFQLNINDYQGVRSLQLIVQDLRPSETVALERRREEIRYNQILEGAPITASEGFVPTREEIGSVFTVLRADARLGNSTMSERGLLERANRVPAGASVGTVKLRLILKILTEMGVCRVDGPLNGYYVFEVDFNAPKTTIEASPLLQSLRRQLAAGEA